jgi:unspecific monooxygenase
LNKLEDQLTMRAIACLMLGIPVDKRISSPEGLRLEGNKGSNLPLIDFGSGYHRCLGEQLAMLESTIMLAQLLRYFNWELVNGRSSLENLEQNLLIYPPDGMPLRFQSRNLNFWVGN